MPALMTSKARVPAALFKLVHKHTFAGTKIVVHNGQKGGPAVAAKKPVARRAESARGAPRT